MEYDILLEIGKTVVVFAIVIHLVLYGKKNNLHRFAGFRYIQIGFSLLLFASLLDITDNIKGIEYLVVVGDTPIQAFLEKVVGYLSSSIFILIGFWKLLPVFDKLEKAKEAANHANHAKSQFLSSMSHELRTPMNAILGFGQLLQYDDTLNTEQQSNVKDIVDSGYHLLKLINEILDLAKVESGQIEVSLEAVDIEPVLEECFCLMKSIAAKRNIHIERKVQGKIVIQSDRTRFKQVLLNLLSNAVKYNRDSGSILVEAYVNDAGRAYVGITDTGQGISHEYLDKLFQPFCRLNAEHTSIVGTGIGLTLSKQIVELMNGKIDVKTEVGVGSTFWIELPLISHLN